VSEQERKCVLVRKTDRKSKREENWVTLLPWQPLGSQS